MEGRSNKAEVMIVVVREGIDGGPEAHPVPDHFRDIPPDGPLVSFR